MNIGKKLYISFGIILATVLVLLAINLIAVHREHETKAAAQRSIDMTEATSLVRFQMMQNRLHLQNYLLSGDTRDVEKMNDGEHQLSDALRHAQELANSAQQRGSLEKVQGLEQAWGSDFANPLVDKRRAVDSGNATVAELQIFYLQKDPNSWVSRSSDVLDDVDRENRKLLDERRHSDELAATLTILAAVRQFPVRAGLGIIIAYRTATGITEPLNRLIHVAEQIGQSGDLEHTIDVHGKDEIGQLARTFDSHGEVPEGNGGGFRSHRRGQPGGGSPSPLGQRHAGQCLHPHGGRAARAGAQRARRRLPRWPALPPRWPALPTSRPETACRLLRPSMK